MFDAKRLLDQFVGGPGNQGGGQGGSGGGGDFLRGAGGGALAGGLAAILLGTKTGRKLGGEALKFGGMAVVGALAYKAYRDWQAGKQAAPATAAPQPQSQQPAPVPMLPAPSGTPFNPTTPADLGNFSSLEEIAAAKADGHVDAQEQARIFAEMDKLPLSSEDKVFVMDELRAKLDIDAVAGAASTPEEAAEIYTASLLAIDVDNAAERGYLGMLAARLKLDDALVAHLQQSVATAAAQR